MSLNDILFIVLRGVSFAEGERYGKSSRLSCISSGRRNGFNHVFRVNHRNTATDLDAVVMRTEIAAPQR
jgi:hypothetical protein